VLVATDSDKRWELYRVLGEPVRLRLLSLSAREELSIGELAELLDENQPNVSRHVTALRKLGLLAERKHGTRVFVRLAQPVGADPVVRDALEAGLALCTQGGVFERLPEVIRRRDAAAREFFAKPGDRGDLASFPAELPAYLALLAPLLPARGLAVEVGTGDGRLLEALAPVFEHVLAIDREQIQLDRAAVRLGRRGYHNVTLLRGELGDDALRAAVQARGGADAVFASRVLHHAPRPADAIGQLATLVRPGGHVLVLDYVPHDDERMREDQADLWLGFSADELAGHGSQVGLRQRAVVALPASFHPAGPDAHLGWQAWVAQRVTPSDTATDTQDT
jgi:DNA-binding transcriptional ArsR family regulator